MSEGFGWIFPGQGSQAVGMGKDLAEHASEAREVYEITDSAIDVEISTLCWHGPADELTRTANQQPAIVATSVAMHRVLSRQGHLSEPEYIAGHSLGEYSALVAGEALELEDAIKLVRLRGKLMEEHGLGGLIAVLGLDGEACQVIANETGVEIANHNAPGQIVLSGTDEALSVAEQAARARGARRVVRLPVNGAFHSSLMIPVAEIMSLEIERTPISEPIAPLVTNVHAEPVSHPDDLRQELVDQIANSVQWVRIMEYMIRVGVSRFVEIGPGSILSGLARRIDRSATVQTTDQLLSVSREGA